MKKIFDIGMFDGADTAYYLESGYEVVAIEANPRLIEAAERKFKGELESGKLKLVNRALAGESGNSFSFTVCAEDLGATSIFEERLSHRSPIASFETESITISELFEEHGIPYYLKIDIEGCDKFCVLPLSEKNRPTYVSFEAGEDVFPLVNHLQSIGYSEFKAVNQCNFLELGSQRSLRNRLKQRMLHLLGYREPKFVRRNGRYFRSGHTSGPVPWESDGNWMDASRLINQWKRFANTAGMWDWYDIYAK